jgi:dolichol kinase
MVGMAALIAKRSKNLPETQQQKTSEMALAAHLCGATVPFVTTPGIFAWADSRMLYETAINQVQSLMTANLWDEAYSEGQSLPIDQGVALAIQALKE